MMDWISSYIHYLIASSFLFGVIQTGNPTWIHERLESGAIISRMGI